MELSGKILKGGNQARSWAIDGITNGHVAVIAHGIQKTPARKIGKGISVVRRRAKMRLHKN